MNLVVSIEWLAEHMADENIRIVDCRFNLADSEEGKRLYLKDHIPGAIYFHLNQDLSGQVSPHGGRHPLPSPDRIKETLERAGIGKDITVIAYDGGEGAFASRLWWLLKYVGHEKVYILNGGYKAWNEAGYKVSDEVPSVKESNYEIQVNKNIYASYEDVKNFVENKDVDTVLIDSRDKKRYLGIEEPIDKRAGRIPGAINKVWTESYKDGFFKTDEEQEKRFSDIEKSKKVIVYCGSGVTATPNFMALKAAGYEDVKLYVGSYSDWVSYDENKVEKGE